MSDPPTVSVVVTCYNLGRYLDEAVESVLAQTCSDFEIIIVDDGSTDPDTCALLAEYQRPKTRVVHIENRGLSGARNEGIRQATGRYVCTLDADDLLERTYFEKAVAVLNADPSVTFVSHWLRTFGDEEREWKPVSADFPALLDMNSINGAALVRREVVAGVGGYDESMRHGCEDWDLWITLVERGFRGVILPEILFFYRRRADSMSRVMMEGDTHPHLYRYLVEKHRASFETHLAALLLRRESDRTAVLAESHDLALDCDTVLAPETARLHEGLRVARRKIGRLRARRGSEMEASHHTRALIEMDAELSRRAQIMNEMNTELGRRAQVMDEMNTELARRAQVMDEMNTELARRAQVMDEMDTELGRRARVLTEMDTELSHRAGILNEMHAELSRRSEALSAMDTELTRRAEVISAKDIDLSLQQQVIGAQTEELEQRAGALAARDEQLTALTHHATALETDLQRDREGIAGLQREIYMLRQSFSWRFTRPLRTVYSWLFERK